jgi:FlaG/FlaF family flagellin (archaellin)
MSKGVMEAMGIAIAVVLLALVGVFAFRSINTGIENGNKAITKTEKINAALDESEYTQYDNAIVTGSQVLQVIKSNTESGVAINVKLYSGDEVSYVYGSSNYAELVKNASKKGSSSYITPSAQFYGQVSRSDVTGEINKLTFTIQ